jgi:arsenite methyltransferase
MAGMTWFWRLVCSPDCSEACQVNCPGCSALAGEWEQQGRRTVDVQPRQGPFRWSRFRYLWRCWSRSVSARALARLRPGRRSQPVSASAGCGCGPESVSASTGCGCGPASVSASAGCGCHPAASTATTISLGQRDAGGPSDSDVKEEVRRHYSEQASGVIAGVQGGCCSPGLPADVSCTVLYDEKELQALPVEALMASLGCGNPLARADLAPGEVVLDLGSGGGMDVFVAAARVVPGGRVIGLDMSAEMLQLAAANAAKVGATNVEFRRGDMEAIPVADASVDVIISNCVVNLAPDKDLALREAFRVLRPGGRLAISDIVTRESVPPALKGDLTAWAACLGGALTEQEYREHLTGAGFVDVEIERGREYTAADAESAGLGPLLARLGVDGALRLGFASTGVRARKAGTQTNGHDRISSAAVSSGGHESGGTDR